jgi:GTPase SAR1 family protein
MPILKYHYACICFFQQPNNTVDNEPSVVAEINQPSEDDTKVSSNSTMIPRANVLASGYDTFQLQIELAGQVFTVDPVMRQNIFNMFNEFNVIICGSARVGKSTLINAICDRTLAKTSPGLDSCTKEVSRYVLKETCCVNKEWITYTYNFWDTPGFESWNETDIRTNFNKIMQKPKSDPLCMIYCASPGSFADTQQIKWLLDVCIREHKLLCALVVTNKWAGEKKQRLAILNTYKELLVNYHEQTSDEHGITYFGNAALCTMVNAQPYIDEDQDINHPQQGVDELIEGIMTCFDDDGKIFHWCMAALQKKGLKNNFKGIMKQRFADVQDFFTKRFMKK